MLNFRKFAWQAALLITAVLGLLFACLPSAGADGPPPTEAPIVEEFVGGETPEVHPCFRQDAECYIPPSNAPTEDAVIKATRPDPVENGVLASAAVAVLLLGLWLAARIARAE